VEVVCDCDSGGGGSGDGSNGGGGPPAKTGVTEGTHQQKVLCNERTRASWRMRRSEGWDALENWGTSGCNLPALTPHQEASYGQVVSTTGGSVASSSGGLGCSLSPKALGVRPFILSRFDAISRVAAFPAPVSTGSGNLGKAQRRRRRRTRSTKKKFQKKRGAGRRKDPSASYPPPPLLNIEPQRRRDGGFSGSIHALSVLSAPTYIPHPL